LLSPSSKAVEDAFIKDFTRGEDGKRGTPLSAENSQYFSNLPAVDTLGVKSPGVSAPGTTPEVYNPVMKLSSSRSARARKPLSSDDPWSTDLSPDEISSRINYDRAF